jgi:intracellular septation protein
MKLLFDLFPVILFFGAYSLSSNIYTATAVAIVATFAQVAYSWLRHRKVDTMLWVSLVIITVMGGATLLLHNKAFILWKPTALYWFFAIALLGSHWLRGINLIEKLMGAQMALPATIWTRLLFAWSLFFIAMGFINLFVAFHFTEAVWVKFKLFGTLGLTVVFALAQGAYVSRYIENKDGTDSSGTP